MYDNINTINSIVIRVTDLITTALMLLKKHSMQSNTGTRHAYHSSVATIVFENFVVRY